MSNHLMIDNFDEILAEHIISDAFFRISDSCMVLYVSKEKISEKTQDGFVSLKQLKNLQTKLKQKHNVNSELVLLDSDNLKKMSEGFEVLLKTTYPSIVDSASISFLNAQKVNATIKIANGFGDKEKEEINAFLKGILNSAKIDILSLQWDEIELPSLIEILSVTKKLQPVKLEKIHSCLSNAYIYLQTDWLNKQLDKLIKKRLIVREQETETYSLTANGLNVLPKIASKNNSDIVRALDLGRRKW